MTSQNSESTQRGLATGILVELEAEGYRDAEPVGRDGFGLVYRSREPALDRVVAIKVLSSGQAAVDLEHFDREQRAAGRISGYPSIVSVGVQRANLHRTPLIVMA